MNIKQLRRFCGVAALSMCSVTSVKASTFQISGTVSSFDGGDPYGTLTGTYDATGLPSPDPNNITASITNVNLFVSLSDGTTYSGMGGSGGLGQDVDDSSLYDIYFNAGGVEFSTYVPLAFNGNGGFLDNNGENDSLAHFGEGDFIFDGSSAPVATPEPESLALLATGLSMSGLAWGAAKRRLTR